MTPSPCPRCGWRRHTEDDLIPDIYPHTLHECGRCGHVFMSAEPEQPAPTGPVRCIPEEVARLKRACLQMEIILFRLGFSIPFDQVGPDSLKQEMEIAIASGAACRRRVTEAEMISPPSETQGK